MEVGKYSSKKVDFTKFDCRRFSPILWDASLYGQAGCGYNMLASLVGKDDPYTLRRLNKNQDSCEDKFVISYLKKHNFTTRLLTKCNLTNTQSILLDGKIKPYNVFISSSLVRKNEASWFIGYSKYWLHNQEIIPMNVLDMLNFPVESVYLIWHKKYK